MRSAAVPTQELDDLRVPPPLGPGSPPCPRLDFQISSPMGKGLVERPPARTMYLPGVRTSEKSRTWKRPMGDSTAATFFVAPAGSWPC